MADKLTPAALKRARSSAKEYFVAAPESPAYEERFELKQTLRIQRSGHEMVYCQIGRGKRQKIGDPRIMTLERIAYLARELLNEAHDFGAPLKRDPQRATLAGFITQVYAPWLRSNRRRPDTTLADLKRNFSAIYPKRLTDIKQADLNRYVTRSLAQGRAPATIRRSLNNLQRVVRLAIDNNYLRDNPFKGWEKPKAEEGSAPRFLSEDEERALRSALIDRDDRARRERVTANDWRRSRGYKLLPEVGEKEFPDHLTPMVLTSLNTGVRYGELTGLEWSAIDLQTRTLTVTGKTSKGAKTRHIPLNAEALDVLTRWKAQGKGKGLVFTNADGERIGSVKTAWTKLLSDAAIESFRWHDLRHSFASKLVQKGVALPVVRDLLGHGDFKLTLRYAHLSDDQKVDAVARLAA